MSKYHAHKITANGEVFDSKKEYQRWLALQAMEAHGDIFELRRQVPYELIPKQRGRYRTERPISYVADFVYTDRKTGEQIVEDVKGYRTPEYRMKRKMLLWRYGISILET